MTKKRVHKQQQTPGRYFPWLGAIAGLALLLIGGIVLWAVWGDSPSVPRQVTGAPRLAVVQPMIEEGDVKLGQTVRSTFRLQNVGDQPLEILGQPSVEVIEGC